MSELGKATPMDRQETCANLDKHGNLEGIPCGHYHWVGHVCLFDLTYPTWRCTSYPKCKKRLKKRPKRNIPGKLYVYEDIVIYMEEA